METVWEGILEIVDGQIPPLGIVAGAQHFYRLVEGNVDFLLVGIKLSAPIFNYISHALREPAPHLAI